MNDSTVEETLAAPHTTAADEAKGAAAAQKAQLASGPVPGAAQQQASAAEKERRRAAIEGNTHGKNKWAILYTVLVMTFMACLDSSIVNVALPVMQKALNAGEHIQLVSSAYLIATCIAMLPFGFLGDSRGKVNIFQFGVALFTAGSLLCGLSKTLEFLVVARIIQGVGCAGAMANNMGIITEAFPAKERGRAMGMLATFVALGMMCGPVVGGFLVAAFPWESIFLINIPVGVISFLVGLKTLPHVRPGKDAPKAMPLGEAVRLCFSSQAFVVNLACMLIVFTGIGASEYILPFYFQDCHGFSSSVSGLLFLSFPVVNALVGPISGSISDRIGCEIPTTVGLGIYVCGLMADSFLTETSAIPLIVASVAATSLGTSTFQSPNNSLYMGSAPREALGFAGSLSGLARYAGMAIGITLASAVFYGQMSVAAGETVASADGVSAEVFLYGYRFVFYVLAAAAAFGFALTVYRLIKAQKK